MTDQPEDLTGAFTPDPPIGCLLPGTALGEAQAAIARVHRLADLIEAGAPWTRNAGELAGRIRDALKPGEERRSDR